MDNLEVINPPEIHQKCNAQKLTLKDDNEPNLINESHFNESVQEINR